MPGQIGWDPHNDDAHAVADDPLEQSLEAGPTLDRILAADGNVVELADKIEAYPLGEAGDGLALARVTVFVRRWPPSSCVGRRLPRCGRWPSFMPTSATDAAVSLPSAVPSCTPR